MILLHISAQGSTDDIMVKLLDHIELQAGLWAMLHKEAVQVQSRTFDAPVPQEQKINEMVLG